MITPAISLTKHCEINPCAFFMFLWTWKWAFLPQCSGSSSESRCFHDHHFTGTYCLCIHSPEHWHSPTRMYGVKKEKTTTAIFRFCIWYNFGQNTKFLCVHTVYITQSDSHKYAPQFVQCAKMKISNVMRWTFDRSDKTTILRCEVALTLCQPL